MPLSPYDCDGTSYWGTIAQIYNNSTDWLSSFLSLLFGIHQSSLLFSFVYSICELFGFSFATAIIVKAVVLFIQCLLVVWLVRRISPKLNWLWFGVILFGVFCAGGIFHARDTLIDFRIDFTGGLWTTIALLSLSKRGMAWLFVPLAVNERFHNLMILGSVLALMWLRAPKQFFLSKEKRQLLLGLAAFGAIRFNYLYREVNRYWEGHLSGTENFLRGFRFSFFEGIEHYLYLFNFHHNPGIGLWVVLSFFLVAVVCRPFKIRTSWQRHSRVMRRFWPLIAGAGVAFFLLAVNATRGNANVLRLVLLPGLTFIAIQLALVISERDRMKRSARFAVTILLIGIVGLAVTDEARQFLKRKPKVIRRLIAGNYHHKGVSAIFQAVYSGKASTNQRRILSRSFFSCRTLTNAQWEIFVAEQGLRQTNSRYFLAYSPNWKLENTIYWDKLHYIDFFAVGSKGCHSHPRHPAEVFGPKPWRRYSSYMREICQQRIASYQTAHCQIEVFRCEHG